MFYKQWIDLILGFTCTCRRIIYCKSKCASESLLLQVEILMWLTNKIQTNSLLELETEVLKNLSQCYAQEN